MLNRPCSMRSAWRLDAALHLPDADLASIRGLANVNDREFGHGADGLQSLQHIEQAARFHLANGVVRAVREFGPQRFRAERTLVMAHRR